MIAPAEQAMSWMVDRRSGHGPRSRLWDFLVRFASRCRYHTVSSPDTHVQCPGPHLALVARVDLAMEDVCQEEDVYFDPELFINKDYCTVEYLVDDVVQPILCSTASSTDYDLTGQTVWPVSHFLAWYIAKNRELFEGKEVLELGAGCGLSGLVASRFAAVTFLTDGNDIVLELLGHNAERQQADGRSNGPVLVTKLLWGDEASLHEALRRDEGRGSWRPDVLIGADVVCWPDYVMPLLQTTKRLLLDARQPAEACMYLGFVCRATNTERLMYDSARAMGLRIERVPAESFLPSEIPNALRSANELQLLVLRVDADSPHAHLQPRFELPAGARAAPC